MNVAPPCIQPAPMPRMADYNGPLQKLVGTSPGRWNARQYIRRRAIALA